MHVPPNWSSPHAVARVEFRTPFPNGQDLCQWQNLRQAIVLLRLQFFPFLRQRLLHCENRPIVELRNKIVLIDLVAGTPEPVPRRGSLELAVRAGGHEVLAVRAEIDILRPDDRTVTLDRREG